jgi:hypothetical protein
LVTPKSSGDFRKSVEKKSACCHEFEAWWSRCPPDRLVAGAHCTNDCGKENKKAKKEWTQKRGSGMENMGAFIKTNEAGASSSTVNIISSNTSTIQFLAPASLVLIRAPSEWHVFSVFEAKKLVFCS